MTTSCLQLGSQSVEDEARSRNIVLDALYPSNAPGSPWQWGLVSEPWPAICCSSTLAWKGAFFGGVWQDRSKTGQIERAMSINNLAAKATFLLLNLSTLPLLSLGAVNVEIPFGAAYGSKSTLLARGAPRAMEMSWSGISKILAAGHAGRLKSAYRGITIMDPFRS